MRGVSHRRAHGLLSTFNQNEFNLQNNVPRFNRQKESIERFVGRLDETSLGASLEAGGAMPSVRQKFSTKNVPR